MALRMPDRWPEEEDVWEPPQTEERLDGPGRGKGHRPPTTGTLPPGGDAEAAGRVVVLATQDTRDKVYIQTVLGLARLLYVPSANLVTCTLAQAPLTICRLQPALIVVGDRTHWRWGSGQVELCRALKRTWRIEVPLVVLYTGRRVFGRTAMARVPADAVISTATSEHEVAFRFGDLLERQATPQ